MTHTQSVTQTHLFEDCTLIVGGGALYFNVEVSYTATLTFEDDIQGDTSEGYLWGQVWHLTDIEIDEIHYAEIVVNDGDNPIRLELDEQYTEQIKLGLKETLTPSSFDNVEMELW